MLDILTNPDRVTNKNNKFWLMNMGKKQTRLLCYIQLAKKYILNVAKLIYISFENNIILMLDNSKTLKLSQLDKQ